MIGASMNCRGVGKRGMSVFLADFLKVQQLDFIGLQETIKKNYSPAFFRRIDPEGTLIGSGSVLLAEVVVSWVVLGYPSLPFVILTWENFISR
jgi:hypothetical protein